MICNVCRVLPTEENLEMMESFFDRLCQREEELKRPHLLAAKQPEKRA
jgi:hypothetical protein